MQLKILSSGERSMKYAICNETFGDWPLEQALELARATGYTGWEVAPFMLTSDIESFSTSDRKSYRDQVEKAGLQIIGLHWLLAKTTGYHLTTPDAMIRKSTSEYLVELAGLCADLGGDLMVLGSPQQRNFPTSQTMKSAMQNAANVLRAAAPEIEKMGVRIAIEPLGRGEGNFLNTAEEGRQLMAMIDSPNIKLHLDVKAMSDEPTPTPQIIRESAEAMIHFHANDPNLLGPGMGEVDFRPIFETLREVEYDGWVSVEVFDYSPGIEKIVKTSMENMIAATEA